MPSSFCAYCCLLYQSSTMMVHRLSMFMTHFQMAWSSLWQSVPKSSHLCWAWHLLSPACQYYRHTFAAFSGWAKAATICKGQNCIFPCVISATLAVHDFSDAVYPGDHYWNCSSLVSSKFGFQDILSIIRCWHSLKSASITDAAENLTRMTRTFDCLFRLSKT